MNNLPLSTKIVKNELELPWDCSLPLKVEKVQIRSFRSFMNKQICAYYSMEALIPL